jgi:hypothetical protein
VGLHNLTGRGLPGARRLQAALAIDFDKTGAAGPGGVKALVVAKCGDVDAFTLTGPKHSLAGLCSDGFAVNGDSEVVDHGRAQV